ncbi:MAG: S-layer homology domain-containing protein [Ruminococcaceae bacterium]|nr:S-layer homology domain-containing protein [Oscillospiraceae bacterium]
MKKLCISLALVIAILPVLTPSASAAKSWYDVSSPFTDVDSDDYFYESIMWAYYSGVTTGTSSTTFSPAATCTRGQVVTFLWRAMGQPEPETKKNPFVDVVPEDYFYKPVLWAVEQGITSGTSSETFSPSDTCTNAHIITFLWRAVGAPAVPITRYSSAVCPESYAWCQRAVSWADSSGLLGILREGFDPTVPCSRGDTAEYMYRALGSQPN